MCDTGVFYGGVYATTFTSHAGFTKRPTTSMPSGKFHEHTRSTARFIHVRCSSSETGFPAHSQWPTIRTCFEWCFSSNIPSWVRKSFIITGCKSKSNDPSIPTRVRRSIHRTPIFLRAHAKTGSLVRPSAQSRHVANDPRNSVIDTSPPSTTIYIFYKSTSCNLVYTTMQPACQDCF